METALPQGVILQVFYRTATWHPHCLPPLHNPHPYQLLLFRFILPAGPHRHSGGGYPLPLPLAPPSGCGARVGTMAQPPPLPCAHPRPPGSAQRPHVTALPPAMAWGGHASTRKGDVAAVLSDHTHGEIERMSEENITESMLSLSQNYIFSKIDAKGR